MKGQIAIRTAMAVVIGLGIDAILAWLLVTLNEPYDKFGSFFIIFFAIVLLPIGFAFYGFIKRWISFWVIEKRWRTKVFLREFHVHKLPHPQGHFDFQDYLNEIVNSEAAPIRIKLFASATLGQFECLKAYKPMSDFLMANIAADRALEIYRPTASESERR